MNQWWCRRLPPLSSNPTLSCSLITPQCVRTTQRYVYPAPLEDHIAPFLTNPDAQPVACSAKNLGGRLTAASVDKKKGRPSSSTSLREMRPSTIWGQYIHTQGGRLKDPAYPTSSGRRRTTKRKKTTMTATAMTTTKIPSQFQRWDIQLRRTQELVGDGQ